MNFIKEENLLLEKEVFSRESIELDRHAPYWCQITEKESFAGNLDLGQGQWSACKP
ncbi:MAG: hypothetical protein WCD89_18330 [Anaerocolumna sp.]